MLGSRVASLSVLTSVRFASRDTGFILKLPPTKNWRLMVAEEKVVGWLEILKARNLGRIYRGPSRA